MEQIQSKTNDGGSSTTATNIKKGATLLEKDTLSVFGQKRLLRDIKMVLTDNTLHENGLHTLH